MFESCRKFLLLTRRCGIGLALIAIIVGVSGCAVKRTIRVSPPPPPGPLKQATSAELAKDVDAWSQGIKTLTATVEFRPTTGSIYTGVIKQYQNVPGYILLKKPSMIRIIGQAPIVRTEIFDMVSNGKEFRVSIPPKNKFIVGHNGYQEPSKKPLENLRPQHILEALLIPPINEAKEKFFSEKAQPPSDQYYVLYIVEPNSAGELSLKRKVWFNRTDLQISRLQLYGPKGSLRENVEYTKYRDFQGVNYPAEITLNRPIEGYKLSITIKKAAFNRPISSEKFILKKPPNATLVTLGEAQ